MSHLKNTFIAMAILAMSPLAKADLIYTDWKTSGDQQALLDTQTGIEWLRLPNTGGMSMHDVKTALSSQFVGWRLPTAAEVETMMDNYYPYPIYAGQTIWSWDSNVPLIRDWVLKFGVINSTVNSNANMIQSYAFYYANHLGGGVGDIQMAGGYYRDTWTAYNVHSYSSALYEDVTSVNYWEGYKNPSIGVFLVSDGGTTLSSLLNPMQNAMNANAPINQTPPPAPVPVGGLWFMGFLMAYAMSGRRISC